MTGLTVSLIGSFRQHYADVLRAAKIFEAEGVAVVSPVISEIINPGKDFARFETDPPLSLDHRIQAATFEKIFASDFVYVVAPHGYIGRTTSYELGRIQERGIRLYFSEPPVDLPTEIPPDLITDPRALVRRLRSQQAIAPRPTRPRVSANLTVDLVIITVRDDRLKVLLVVRGTSPFKGQLALPGGFLRPGETAEMAALRELEEETGLDGTKLEVKQLQFYSEPGRDPRPGRIVSMAFLAIAPNLPSPVAGTDASGADWVDFEPSLQNQLAFDHWQILSDGIERARVMLEHTTVAAAFCGETFTMNELHRIYEIIWGIPLDLANFRRKALKTEDDFVEDTGLKQKSRRGPDASLYRRGSGKTLYPPMLRERLSAARAVRVAQAG